MELCEHDDGISVVTILDVFYVFYTAIIQPQEGNSTLLYYLTSSSREMNQSRFILSLASLADAVIRVFGG